MSGLDNAIQSINAAADRTTKTTEFVDRLSTYDDISDVTNPNTGATVPSLQKKTRLVAEAAFAESETQINQAVSDAELSALAAQSAANYDTEFVAGLTSAIKGKTYLYNRSMWACLNNTTEAPAIGNANWHSLANHGVLTNRDDANAHPASSISMSNGNSVEDEVKSVESRLLGVGASLYKGANGRHVQNGDTIPADTTHLTILINNAPEDVAMSTVASGSVASLTETGATIGGTAVTLHQFRNGGYQATEAQLSGIIPSSGEQWFNTTDNSIHIGDGVTLGGIKQADLLNVKQFGVTGDGVTNDYDAMLNALNYARSVGHGGVLVPDGVYVYDSPVNANDVNVVCSNNAIFKKTNGTNNSGFQKHNRWADASYASGAYSDNTTDSVKFGNVTESWVQPSNIDSERKVLLGLNTTWYDNQVQPTNSYINSGVKHHETLIHYGRWNKAAGNPTSGSATTNIGTIVVHGCEGGSDGTSRTEIIPFGAGAVVKKDAELRPSSLNIYNDFVVSGVVDPTGFQREAFLAGISILAQTYSPYNAPDNDHSGSFGICIANKPQRNGAFDQGDITTDRAHPLRAMLSICGWSGEQTATSGAHPDALIAAQYGILIGGGNAGEGGGSQWIGSFARSKFNHGAMITDYRLNGLLIDQPSTDAESFVNAIHVKQGAGKVFFENGNLTFSNLPDQTDSTGLTPGQVYRDSTANNVLRVAL